MVQFTFTEPVRNVITRDEQSRRLRLPLAKAIPCSTTHQRSDDILTAGSFDCVVSRDLRRRIESAKWIADGDADPIAEDV